MDSAGNGTQKVLGSDEQSEMEFELCAGYLFSSVPPSPASAAIFLPPAGAIARQFVLAAD
jgi:hypothetical protein